jgi:hypothetical protein
LTEGQNAYFGVFERDRLAAVAVTCDAIESDDVPEHVIAGNLFASVLGEKGGLARPEADRVERGERVAASIDRRPFLEAQPIRDERIELIHPSRFQPHRQA